MTEEEAKARLGVMTTIWVVITVACGLIGLGSAPADAWWQGALVGGGFGFTTSGFLSLTGFAFRY